MKITKKTITTLVKQIKDNFDTIRPDRPGTMEYLELDEDVVLTRRTLHNGCGLDLYIQEKYIGTVDAGPLILGKASYFQTSLTRVFNKYTQAVTDMTKLNIVEKIIKENNKAKNGLRKPFCIEDIYINQMFIGKTKLVIWKLAVPFVSECCFSINKEEDLHSKLFEAVSSIIDSGITRGNFYFEITNEGPKLIIQNKPNM